LYFRLAAQLHHLRTQHHGHRRQPEAALLAGVNVDRTKILIFAVHGLIGALAGVILARA
jgi:branched-subunit amino acid ABC-type transport system permease component